MPSRPFATSIPTAWKALWESAFSWEAYLNEEVQTNRDLWEGVYRRAAAPAWWEGAAADAAPGWRLLVISEDWCGDAANSLPVLTRLVQAIAGAELRVVKRDENPELMDRFLTGGSRSIPIALVLDDHWKLAGHWGPRPAPLQEFVLREKATGERPVEEIYRDVRAWYARDRGETIARELLGVLAPGVEPGRDLPPPA